MRFLLALCALALAAADLQVLPPAIELNGPESWHQLLAQAPGEDWTRRVIWTSSNPAVAKVDAAGLVTPWIAGIGMSGSSLAVVLNALRLRRRGATATSRE